MMSKNQYNIPHSLYEHVIFTPHHKETRDIYNDLDILGKERYAVTHQYVTHSKFAIAIRGVTSVNMNFDHLPPRARDLATKLLSQEKTITSLELNWGHLSKLAENDIKNISTMTQINVIKLYVSWIGRLDDKIASLSKCQNLEYFFLKQDSLLQANQITDLLLQLPKLKTFHLDCHLWGKTLCTINSQCDNLNYHLLSKQKNVLEKNFLLNPEAIKIINTIKTINDSRTEQRHNTENILRDLEINIKDTTYHLPTNVQEIIGDMSAPVELQFIF